MSDTDSRPDGAATDTRSTDERLSAIEAQLRTISRWVTWLGFLSVVVLLVVVIDSLALAG